MKKLFTLFAGIGVIMIFSLAAKSDLESETGIIVMTSTEFIKTFILGISIVTISCLCNNRYEVYLKRKRRIFASKNNIYKFKKKSTKGIANYVKVS